MPNVPKVTDQEKRLGPLPEVRFSPARNATEETFGGGEELNRMGAVNEQFLTTGLKIAIQQKKYADDTVVTEADTKAGIVQSGIEESVRKMKGREAAGATDYVKSTWIKEMESIEKGLNNDEQRNDFRRKNAARYISTLDTAKKHSTTESDRYAKQVTDGAVIQWRNTAVSKFDDPNAVDESLFAQMNVRAQEALNNGLASIEGESIKLDDSAKKMISDEVSKTVAQVYNRMLLSGMEEDAEKFRKKYGSLLESRFGTNYSSEDVISMDKMKTVGLKKAKQQQDNEIKLAIESNSKTVIDETLAGVFDDRAKLELLHAAGIKNEPTGITGESYRWVKDYMDSEPYLAEKEKRLELAFGIPEQFFRIDTNMDKRVDPKVKLADVAVYKRAALDAYLTQTITKQELDSKIAAVDKVFNKGIATESFRNGQKVYRYYHDWFKQNLAGFVINVEGKSVKQPLTKEAQQEALAFVGNGLMDYMQGKQITDEDIPKVTQMFLGKYLQLKFPELVGKTELPNAIMDMEANFKSVYGGKNKSTNDFIVQNVDLKKIPHDPLTQKVQVDRKTGKVRVVPK